MYIVGCFDASKMYYRIKPDERIKSHLLSDFSNNIIRNAFHENKRKEKRRK